MTRPRKKPSLEVRLAAALLTIMRANPETGKLERVISHDEAKTLTAKQIIRRYTFDHHPIPHAHDGPDLPWNLTPLLRGLEHDVKTRTIDVPMIAKVRRVTPAHEEFRRRMLKPGRSPKPKKSRWGSRPFQPGATK